MENSFAFVSALNVNEFNFTQDVNVNVLPHGWYKIQLTNVEEVKPSKSGTCEGAKFEFTVVAGHLAGSTFQTWFAVRALTSKGDWLVNKFKTVFARIAQTVGITRLANVAQLEGKPFFALVRQTTSQRTTLDETTGEERTQTMYNNEFGAVPADSILSIEDYYRAFPPDNSNADAFVKLDANGVNSGTANDVPF
jgi:hypothetical protein